MEVILDFETVNPYCDLATVGSTVYAQHWATEILCLRWRIGDGPIHIWRPGDDPTELLAAINA